MGLGLRMFAIASALFTATVAAAQSRLTAPDEVVIHLHSSLQNADFVDGLVCELGRVLAAPVRATTIDLPLAREHLATASQLDAMKVNRLFAHATDGDADRSFRYLILAYDMKVEGLNYLFALTPADGGTTAVMSVVRLAPTDSGLSRKRVSDVTGDRLYKLMLKSVAVLAGLRTGGCIMAFPRSLQELDAKSAEFCPADRAALVDAGVLKARPFGACSAVAMVDR